MANISQTMNLLNKSMKVSVQILVETGGFTSHQNCFQQSYFQQKPSLTNNMLPKTPIRRLNNFSSMPINNSGVFFSNTGNYF